jgi:transposase
MGLKPTIRRVWAPKGQRPTAPSDQHYQWLYVYGFVQPQTGQTQWLVLPSVSTTIMSTALRLFAKAVGAGPNKHIVMVLDQAGWHTSKKLVLPEGIHVVHLPSHTPELQPAERLWPFVKEAVANRCMPDLDTLEELVVERCDELTRQPQTIRSQTHFHWWPTV